jgi:hypothetical protein
MKSPTPLDRRGDFDLCNIVGLPVDPATPEMLSPAVVRLGSPFSDRKPFILHLLTHRPKIDTPSRAINVFGISEVKAAMNLLVGLLVDDSTASLVNLAVD